MATRTNVAPVAVEELRWGNIIAGAICAAALASVLHAFAGAVGVSLSSTAPTWRDSSTALTLLSGLYLILVALASYGFGAYVAARTRVRSANAGEAADFEDGINGLLMWALATLMTGILALAVAQATTRLNWPSVGSAETTVAGENMVSYDLDRLFRGERRPVGIEVNMGYPRAEAARIFLTASSHRGIQPDDRNYLVRLVSALTGLAAPEAERRVDQIIPQVKENISRARRTTVILGFMVGAATLLGAAAAWYVSIAVGRHRDGRETLHSLWDWGRSTSW